MIRWVHKTIFAYVCSNRIRAIWFLPMSHILNLKWTNFRSSTLVWHWHFAMIVFAKKSKIFEGWFEDMGPFYLNLNYPKIWFGNISWIVNNLWVIWNSRSVFCFVFCSNNQPFRAVLNNYYAMTRKVVKSGQ